jgi:hypothetical protein
MLAYTNPNGTYNIIMDNHGFYVMKPIIMTAPYVAIPSQYSVSDFAILGDTLYFCGKEEAANKGYIAYIRINELLAGGEAIYTHVPTTTEVNKIKTYYNDVGERIVVGIGKQIYAAAPQLRICGMDENCPPNDPDSWTFDIERPYDCFIVYKVIENIIDTANHGLLNTPPSYVTTHPCEIYNRDYRYPEIFQDIAITENYIGLLSINTGGTLTLRRFDKNNFTPTSVKLRLYNGYLNCVYAPLGAAIYSNILLEPLDDDNVALAYFTYTTNAIGADAYYSIITKMNMNTLSLVHSSVFAETKAGILDIEYNHSSNSLLVLKDIVFSNEYLTNNYHIYNVNMADDIFANNNVSYGSTYLGLPTNNDYYGLYQQPYSMYYAAIGRGRFAFDIMKIFDIDYNYSIIKAGNCHSVFPQKVWQTQTLVLSDNNLNKCTIAHSPDCYNNNCGIYLPAMIITTWFDAFIERLQPVKDQIQIEEECLE